MSLFHLPCFISIRAATSPVSLRYNALMMSTAQTSRYAMQFECLPAILLAMTVAMAAAPGLAQTMVFPGKQWEEATPRSQGVDGQRLEEAARWLGRTIGRDGVRELVVVRNGRMIWKGDDIDKMHGVWSVTKCFTSTVLGLLIDDGRCTLDSPAGDFVPVMKGAYPGVTLRHFATMTSGYQARGDEPQGSYLHGPSRTPFAPGAEPLFTPPGSQYAYWDSAMNQFGHVLSRVAGEPMEDLFRRRIAGPIGMDPGRWRWGNWGKIDGIVINGGAGNGGRHVEISAREAARFGLLFLNKGNWNDTQLISARWIEQATRVQVPALTPLGHPESRIDGRGCYGLNWWVNGLMPDGKRRWPSAPPGTFAASGHNNNKIIIVPEWNMVIVRLGLDGKAEEAVWDGFLERVAEAVGR
jgi:CubicO group peptidase (beta-lactamase class C family)